MEFKFKQCIKNAEAVFDYGDEYLKLDYMGVHFLSKDNLEERDRIVDFGGYNCGIYVKDKDCLIAHSFRGDFRVYDLKGKKMMFDVKPKNLAAYNPFGFTAALDFESFYGIEGSIQLDSDTEEPLPDIFASGKNHIYCYSLENGERIDEIETEKDCYDICLCKFLNGYVIYYADGTLGFMDKDKKIVEIPHVISCGTSPLIDEDNQVIYAFSDFGIRVIDKNFNEIDKYDFVADEQVEVSAQMYAFIKHLRMPISKEDTKSIEKETLLGIIQLNKDRLIVGILQNLKNSTLVLLVDSHNGKVVGQTEIGAPVNEMYHLHDGKHFVMVIFGQHHVMEVVE